jgi:peptide-methionine (S)-S-oxide reductase
MTTYVLGGGCFWCLNAVYRQIRGIDEVACGYTGGSGPASYPIVSTGKSGYIETVRVSFQEKTIPPEVILDLFFLVHNPTTPDRQGADIGSQYRSAMFYTDTTQQQDFQAAVLRAASIWDDPIVTTILPLDVFHIAEDEHQDYFHKNPESGYCSVVIAPKITKARSVFSVWFKGKV